MIPLARRRRAMFGVAALLFAALSSSAAAQMPALIGRDSVTVQAGADYAAGDLHRSLFGDNYRTQWTTPIKVPVLDLARFAGGLTPTRTGGGRQTKSLRFVAPDSAEYVFRPVFKAQTILPDQFKRTIIWNLFRDQGSASHPGGTVASPAILEAAGLLHPTPRLAVMPDDPRLGEFRKEFANVLGTIEEYPSTPKQGQSFAGASEIIDAEKLLEEINKKPSNQIDTKAFLRARLVDLLVNDNDRHPDQWKWARLTDGKDALWEPIPRDRDKVLLSYEGKVLDLARKGVPALVKFENTYPAGSALFENAMEFDRRMLGGLDKSAWTSEAISVKQTITDAVIDKTIRAMPPEYAESSMNVASKLRARRDGLPEAAARYYDELWAVAEVHGTDADDQAVVTRNADGSVTVQLQSEKSAPYLTRRFDPSETRDVRIYLHDGDDRAVVTGASEHSIPVRIIGGNGTNTFEDRSTVGGEKNPSHFYDEGTVTGVKYEPDTALKRKDPAMELNYRYNRRPWVRAYGTLIPPQSDRGVTTTPVAGVRTGHGIGLVPKVGLARTVYGFRYVPYESRIQGDIAYSLVHRGFAANLFGDRRLESSDIHVPIESAVTQLDIVQFRGFGNDTPEREGKFYDVNQTAWRFFPALARSFNEASDISVGPTVRYTSTDSVADRFISEVRPYGMKRFGEVGALLKMHYDTRSKPDTTRSRAVFEGAAGAYPGMWDVATAYESVEGAVTTYINIPAAMRPVIVLRGGGKKLFGNFPYFDAAFLGGGSTLRTEHRQRFAGDASLYGSGELRVPVAKFPLILPLDVGLLGFGEAGRVYEDGDSPGGWHKAAGAGFWIGFVNPGTSVNFLVTNKKNRRTMVSLGFAY